MAWNMPPPLFPQIAGWYMGGYSHVPRRPFLPVLQPMNYSPLRPCLRPWNYGMAANPEARSYQPPRFPWSTDDSAMARNTDYMSSDGFLSARKNVLEVTVVDLEDEDPDEWPMKPTFEADPNELQRTVEEHNPKALDRGVVECSVLLTRLPTMSNPTRKNNKRKALCPKSKTTGGKALRRRNARRLGTVADKHEGFKSDSSYPGSKYCGPICSCRCLTEESG